VILAVSILGLACGAGDEAQGPTAVPATAAPREAATAAPATATAVPPATASAVVWTRSGKAPTVTSILAALRESGVSGARALGRPQTVGDGRVVGVASHGPEEGPSLIAYVASDGGGQAQIEGRADLPTAKPILTSLMGPPVVAAQEIGDLDADGEPEAMFFVQYHDEPQPAVGDVARGHYFVVDLDPGPRVAASFESQAHPQADVLLERRATVRREDLDGDGHPDLRVRGRECMSATEGAEDCTPVDERWIWDAPTDAWTRR